MNGMFKDRGGARSSLDRAQSFIDRFVPTSDRRAARQTLWMGAITTAQLLSGFAQLALSARILGPEGFGVLAICMGAAGLFHAFMTMPGYDAITTHVTRSMIRGERSEAAAVVRFTFGAAQGLALLAYALLAAFALTAIELVGVNQADATALLVYGLTGICMATHLESLAALQLADRLPLGLAAVVAGALTRVAALVTVWQQDGGLLMVAWAFVIGALTTGGGLFIAAVAAAGRGNLPEFLRGWSINVPRDVVRFQLLTFAQAKLGALYGHLDVVLLGALAGPLQAGLYRGARQIIGVTLTLAKPVTQAVQAECSRRWYAGEGAALRGLVRRSTVLLVSAAIVLFGILALLYQPIIRIVLGPGFEAVAASLLVMIPGAFVYTGVAVLSILPASTGRALPSLIWTFLALVAQMGALFLLAPEFGSTGAAGAHTVYQLVFATVVVACAVSILRRNEPQQERALSWQER